MKATATAIAPAGGNGINGNSAFQSGKGGGDAKPVGGGNGSGANRPPSYDTGKLHRYWSGFYKKTIKERRTQLSLAFPHLSKASTSLDSFASSAVTSAKTSGQSTPQLVPIRSLAGSSSSLSSASSSFPILMPPPKGVINNSNNSNNSNSNDHANLSSNSNNNNNINSSNSNQYGGLLLGRRAGSHLRVEEVEPPLAKDSLLNFTDDTPSVPSSELERTARQQQQPQQQLQEKGLSMDEESRIRLEKGRLATVISNLEEQRKTIGTPNGSLLEGDLSLDARLDVIAAEQEGGAPFPVQGLDEQIANNMIENCIGTLGLPMGLAFNFTINNMPLVIPMAIEEPSVIAAVSSAAKTISTYKGFQATAPVRNMIVAQVQLLDILDNHMDRVVATMEQHRDEIRDEANEYCPNMVLRGAGVQQVTFHRIRRRRRANGAGAVKGYDLLVKHGVISEERTTAEGSAEGSLQQQQQPQHLSTLRSANRCSEWLVVHLHIDVGDAMGANCANTVAEGIAPFLAKLSGARVGVRILSNLNVDRMAKSTFRLPLSHLAYKGIRGPEVATRILEAYEWAELDPYRATTHNKGVMNGVDAVALATGQDWRAVESGAHAWAGGAGVDDIKHDHRQEHHHHKRKRQDLDEDQQLIYRTHASTFYRSLTRYWVEEDEERVQQGFQGKDALVLCGELEMPIMVGTKGGVLSTNPVHAFTLGIMGYPDSKLLAMAMVSVGLAQNFAALRALVTEGIQRGHMALHARNIAISAGTPPASVDEVAAYMIDTGKIRVGVAKSYMEKRGLGVFGNGL
ncbi:hypothetical protein DFQ27_006356 [Actinomortierella ambigua]|uniref:hydroxymethylglutaryl-CoA reductase (NADPH) n=1 Tax=Actinomortierella ambigua TaxID=1343610 RepID=A0A9P6QGZ9_9FUNG|nr:hypothetical protein DFQ27_006356 [Actinomortierella ambigua]